MGQIQDGLLDTRDQCRAEVGLRPLGDATVEQLCEEYERSCAESRATAAEFDLEHAFEHPRYGPISLRWIYVHMIEETARHAGYADIRRELIDA